MHNLGAQEEMRAEHDAMAAAFAEIELLRRRALKWMRLGQPIMHTSNVATAVQLECPACGTCRHVVPAGHKAGVRCSRQGTPCEGRVLFIEA